MPKQEQLGFLVMGAGLLCPRAVYSIYLGDELPSNIDFSFTTLWESRNVQSIVDASIVLVADDTINSMAVNIPSVLVTNVLNLPISSHVPSVQITDPITVIAYSPFTDISLHNVDPSLMHPLSVLRELVTKSLHLHNQTTDTDPPT
ncbi:hypothetical protein GH714_011557 [Hevea brasiliensis]|uniref:Uncharacterized protein n=1 Tax=Hevea brasiliensis TaxID=3981 RepID=A0A6A6MWX0_HEVBR|nr:hypothetical protein GH714_011557 [Hevea brasiliensis]